MSFLTIFLLLFICPCEEALKILKFHVPSVVIEGSDVNLSCIFELDGHLLYSVRWYKGETEFYNYIPKYTPSIQTFTTEGINIDVTKSQVGSVYLKNVKQSTEDVYRCEISGESPNFVRDYQVQVMKVVVPPDLTPQITSYAKAYRVGDIVMFNCTSAKSKPKVNLTWYLNEIPMEYTLMQKVPIENNESKTVSIAILKFRIKPEHMKYGYFILKCESSLSNTDSVNITQEIKKIYYKKSTITITDADAPGTPFTRSSSRGNNSARQSSRLSHQGLMMALLVLSWLLCMAHQLR